MSTKSTVASTRSADAGGGTVAGEELLDLGEDGVDVAGEVQVVLAGELHQPRRRDGSAR